MKHWFSDGAFRAVLRNSSYMGAAKIAAAPLGIVALGCATRSLTPVFFGYLMLIHAYASGVSEITRFQTWQLIIRYGGPALTRDEPDVARDAVRFGFALDIASGLLGLVGAIPLLLLLSGRLSLSGSTLWLAVFYCTLIPTMTAATPTGVLRMFDRFDLIAAQQLVTPILRAAGAAASLVGHLGFPGLVATWYVADLAGDLALWIFAARELGRQGMRDALRPSLFGAARRLPDAWSFAWTTNIGHSVYSAWGPVSNVIVAAMLGPVAAGLYKIASTLLDAASKPADFLSRGFYPEIMRLDPTSKRPWQLGLRTGILAGLIGLIVVLVITLGGKPLIGLIFGKKYQSAFGLLLIMAWALPIAMSTFPLESLLYMVGRQRTALVAQSAATALYLVLLALFSWRFGLIGSGTAYLIGMITTAAFMLMPVLQHYRRRDRIA